MSKKWFESKAKVSGLLLAFASALKLAADYLATGQVDYQAVLGLLNGTGIFGIRDALK